MSALARRWTSLHPGEGRPVAWLFGWYFFAIGAAFAGRSVRDALFLAHVGADRLPAMYVVTPVVAAIVGPLYVLAERRFVRRRLVLGSLLGSAATMAAFSALTGAGPAVDYALYIVVNVMNTILVGQVWMVAGDRFTSRDAKRVFGFVGAGGTAADIVVGAGISVGAARFGAESLLPACVGLLLGAAACAWGLQRTGGPGWEAHGRVRAPVGAPPLVRPPGTAHLRLVALGTVFGIVVVTLVDFQFKAVAADAFGADRAGMASWFGTMSVASGVVSFVLQLVATRWVLRHAGVAGALMVLPVGLGLGEAALVALPGLAVATVLKAGDETLRFSVHDAATQLAYLPVPSAERARVRASIDGRWRPGAQVGLGLVLLAYRSAFGTSIRPLAAAAVVGIAAWIATSWRLRAAYRVSLAETLRTRSVAFDGVDSAGVPAEEWASLRAGLAADDPATRAAALELARPLAEGLVDALAPSLGHSDPTIRRAAARALAGTSFRGWDALLADPDAELRALARSARAAGDDLAARGDVAAALRDPDGEAARRMVRACGTGTEALLVDAVAEVPVVTGITIVSRLGDLSTPAARAALVPLLDHPRLGTAACRALARATRADPLADDEPAAVERRIRAELEGAFVAMAAAETMGKAESALAPDGTREANPFAPGDGIGAAGLLSKALRERQEAHRERVLWLLSARYPGAGLERVRTNLAEAAATRRANAVELLDSTLRGDLRRLVVALVDDTPRYEKLAAAARLVELPRRTRDAWLVVFLADPAPFLATCAAYYVGAFRLGALRPEVARCAAHADPTLGETARHTLTLLDAA